MTHRRIRVMAVLFVLQAAFGSVGTVHAAGTDEIKHYAVDILPQSDGSLLDTYAIKWCVLSNSAGPLTWITLGMPNEQYQITATSGDIASARPADEGFDYRIRIDLPDEVYAGDCVDFTVQVHQFGMAHLDETSREIGFQFTPGWFNDVPVEQLQITWHLPADAAQLKSFDPQPTRLDASQAVWESDLQPGEKYPISVVYDQAAFPDFDPKQTDLPQPTNSIPSGSGSPATDPGMNEVAGSEVSPLPIAFDSITLTTCMCMCVTLILVMIVLIVVFRIFSSAGRSYRSGGFFGGYSGGGGWLGSSGGGFRPSSGVGSSISNRTGGGSGQFGGRGMSCACVSSGCACACAGGGRAGCSRKGFDVSGLFKDRQG